VESLEVRSLLTTYGLPWADPRSLSISFPGEGTPIGGTGNNIRQTLDTVAARGAWQQAALKAFQTWAEVANINVGLVGDRSDAFGAAGLASNDPRFGEFRIGSFSQTNVLANSVPWQPCSGQRVEGDDPPRTGSKPVLREGNPKSERVRSQPGRTS